MNRKFNKLALLLPIAVSSALVGCSQSTSTLVTPSTTATSSQTSLDTFSLQCQSIQQPNMTDATLSGISLVGRAIADAPFDTSAAEIVSYDSCTDKLYVVNAQAQKVDVLSMDADSAPTSEGSIDLQSAAAASGINIGAANSVSTHQGLVAVAIENADKQQNGIIALYRSDTLELITTYTAGALPDMVSFSKDGHYIASANEGEPNSDYSIDPEGSVTLVDLTNGPLQAKVTQIDFKAFNQGQPRYAELTDKVRISAPNATVTQDLEPEYLTFADNGKLYVALQENNALAAIDVASAEVDAILGLGGKPWDTAQLDASNKDKNIGNLQSYAMLEGLYMPDSITSYSVDGNTYIVTANEGDGREYGIKTTQQLCDDKGFEWDGDDYQGTENYTTEKDFCIAYVDEVRGKKLDVDANHPLAGALKDNKQLARLKVIKPQETLAADQKVQAFGSRSFSIWDESGELVFDSGDDFARIVLEQDPANFNSTNDNNQSGDDRSDDKGIEPEAIEVAEINGKQYAFIGLERQGGIMVYDVTQPKNASFISYLNNRDFTQPVCTKVDEDGDCDNETYNSKAGDLGPESIKYFTRSGNHFIAVGNEVSGSTSVYRVEF
ncbi:choice-of-anchor I family protein [Vibrio cyclitrophicus]|uniref:choice-of-anchor I family protein n=1 Tax=Vibrio cyclitrophicus TaxID=47951 RepID=UPI000C840AF1|nr:choice-of-anchor I family protein [Vibrio cyclitrophicus]MCC4772828.1 choice-of-anchor I family protein [Vibrio cyclitrophicus]MCC4843801.1 choice-of-anchor I family protein [Vibrio cyclitrophicus]PME10630.1 alkaline phosphatase [Vibrio cyclitrophicus]PME53073.1 alkaline phosphatase [Vibrio cyclitrophicus]PME84351.1 alkaline phosphatase [Vibrio cyclitrophicus]